MTRIIAIDRRSYDTWRMRLVLTLMALAVLAFMPAPASAFDLEENLRSQHVQYQGESPMRTTQSDGMSLSQAVASVKRQTGGKVVGAETKVRNGREVHHIKVLTKDGKVKTHTRNGRRR